MRRVSTSSTDDTPSTGPLKLHAIGDVSNSCGVNFAKVANLASLEFMFHLHWTGMPPAEIVSEMSRRGVAPPTKFDVLHLSSMSSQSISNATMNIKKARAS